MAQYPKVLSDAELTIAVGRLANAVHLLNASHQDLAVLLAQAILEQPGLSQDLTDTLGRVKEATKAVDANYRAVVGAMVVEVPDGR